MYTRMSLKSELCEKLIPMFEEPYSDHSEGQKECVEQESKAVKFVKLELLFIITDIGGDYAFSYLTIHCFMPCKSEMKMLSSLGLDYIFCIKLFKSCETGGLRSGGEQYSC